MHCGRERRSSFNALLAVLANMGNYQSTIVNRLRMSVSPQVQPHGVPCSALLPQVSIVFTICLYLPTVEAQMAEQETARSRKSLVNLRVGTDDRGLVTRAAAALGKNHSEFMLDATRQAAHGALLDRTLFRLDADRVRNSIQEDDHDESLSMVRRRGVGGGAHGTRRAARDTAAAAMDAADGSAIGTVTFEQTPHGVLMYVEAAGLPPSAHGIHLHAAGACTPDFKAATGHINPNGVPYGLRHPDGPTTATCPICTPEPTDPTGRNSSPSWCRLPAAICHRCWTRTARR